jgi:hypothetical protein
MTYDLRYAYSRTESTAVAGETVKPLSSLFYYKQSTEYREFDENEAISVILSRISDLRFLNF